MPQVGESSQPEPKKQKTEAQKVKDRTGAFEDENKERDGAESKSLPDVTVESRPSNFTIQPHHPTLPSTSAVRLVYDYLRSDHTLEPGNADQIYSKEVWVDILAVHLASEPKFMTFMQTKQPLEHVSMNKEWLASVYVPGRYLMGAGKYEVSHWETLLVATHQETTVFESSGIGSLSPDAEGDGAACALCIEF